MNINCISGVAFQNNNKFKKLGKKTSRQTTNISISFITSSKSHDMTVGADNLIPSIGKYECLIGIYFRPKMGIDEIFNNEGPGVF